MDVGQATNAGRKICRYRVPHQVRACQDITNGEDSISGLTLQRLKQVGWPASRTILTYQSFDAARMRQEAKGGLLPLLGKLLGDYSVEVGGGQKVHLQGPYAGVLGWPAQCGAADFRCWPTADRANIKQVIEGARSAGVGGAALKKPSSDSEPPAPPSAPTPPVPRGRCGPLFGGAKCDCSRGEELDVGITQGSIPQGMLGPLKPP